MESLFKALNARPDRITRRTGFTVQPAFYRLDVTEHDLGAITTGRHFPGTATSFLTVMREMQASVIFSIVRLQFQTGSRNDTDTPPRRIDNRQRLAVRPNKSLPTDCPA